MREQTISPNDKLKSALQSFDSKFSTLVDYFAIIGFDNVDGQLRDLMGELISTGTLTGDDMGLQRTLQPSTLERFPTVDRPAVAFPSELVSFFLANDE